MKKENNERFYYITGDTKEDIERKWKEREEAIFEDYQEEIKLDWKTKFFLHIARVKIVEHPFVYEVDKKLIITEESECVDEAYVFTDYDEFKRYFLMYLDSVDESIINHAIVTKGSKGQIIALRKLCERIIIKSNVSNKKGMTSSKEFMDSFMKKLENDEFEKDVCPQIDDGFIPTAEQVNDELESYQKLLESGIVEESVNNYVVKRKLTKGDN